MPRSAKIPFPDAAAWTTRHVAAHSKDFTKALATRFGVTRSGAAATVRLLEERGFITRSGGATRPTFAPGTSRLLSGAYDLPGVDESEIWSRDFAPRLDLAPNVENIVHYGLTEMVNNANDHSGGTILQIDAIKRGPILIVSVGDDGMGVFRKIADALGLDDPRRAILELAKGKFTSDPSRHSGEGVFFTSRAFDVFHLGANELVYRHSAVQPDGIEIERLEERAEAQGRLLGGGTVATMVMDVRTDRTLRSVFDRHTTGAPDDLSFERTVIPVRLGRLGNENLLSRSQAKRLTARIERFRVVELDFTGIPEIGQAFADELFRVFADAHPEVTISSRHANAEVSAMIRRIRPQASIS